MKAAFADYAAIKAGLEARLDEIFLEIRSYPSPIAGCDQQFNFLLAQRAQISEFLQKFEVGDSVSQFSDQEIAEIKAIVARAKSETP